MAFYQRPIKPKDSPEVVPAKHGRCTCKEAGQILGKSEMWVRIALQQKLVPFGLAIKMPGGRWSYDIRRAAVYRYAERGLYEDWTHDDEMEDDGRDYPYRRVRDEFRGDN